MDRARRTPGDPPEDTWGIPPVAPISRRFPRGSVGGLPQGIPPGTFPGVPGELPGHHPGDSLGTLWGISEEKGSIWSQSYVECAIASRRPTFLCNAMDRAGLVRWTVDANSRSLPSKQLWVSDAGPLGAGRLLWDLRYFYHLVKAVGDSRGKRDWINWFRQVVVSAAHHGENHMFFRTPDSPPEELGDLSDTTGVYTYLFAVVARTSIDSVRCGYLEYLRQACHIVTDVQTSAVDIPLCEHLRQFGVVLVWHGADRLAGFDTWVRAWHATARSSIRDTWNVMRTDGIIKFAYHQEPRSLSDLVFFLAHFQRTRRGKSSKCHKLSARHELLLLTLTAGLVSVILLDLFDFIVSFKEGSDKCCWEYAKDTFVSGGPCAPPMVIPQGDTPLHWGHPRGQPESHPGRGSQGNPPGEPQMSPQEPPRAPWDSQGIHRP